MSKLAAFDDLLQQYNAFNYHEEPALAQRLHDVQSWIKQRLEHSHQELFNKPETRSWRNIS